MKIRKIIHIDAEQDDDIELLIGPMDISITTNAEDGVRVIDHSNDGRVYKLSLSLGEITLEPA